MVDLDIRRKVLDLVIISNYKLQEFNSWFKFGLTCFSLSSCSNIANLCISLDSSLGRRPLGMGRSLLVQNTPVFKIWLRLFCPLLLGEHFFILSTNTTLAIEIIFLNRYRQWANPHSQDCTFSPTSLTWGSLELGASWVQEIKNKTNIKASLLAEENIFPCVFFLKIKECWIVFIIELAPVSTGFAFTDWTKSRSKYFGEKNMPESSKSKTWASHTRLHPRDTWHGSSPCRSHVQMGVMCRHDPCYRRDLGAGRLGCCGEPGTNPPPHTYLGAAVLL